MLAFRKRSPRYLSLMLVVGASLLLAACGTEHPQTTFSAQGSSARHILNLNNIFLVVAAVVFVLVEGALIYAVFRYRRRPQDGIPLQLHGNQTLEIAWTIIPAIIVLFLATMTFRTQAILGQTSGEPLRVTVIGHQWWWEFRYPDYDIVTANELHLPAGQEVEVTLQSVDVIHSFWFPRLAGKMDVVPGNTNRMTFTPDATTEPLMIRGQCAEFCGGTHAMMGMWAIVEPQADFDAWVSAQQSAAVVPEGITQAAAPAEATATAATTETAQLAPGAGPAARGYQLFQTKGCVGCHAIEGYPNAISEVGPDLTHVGSRGHIVSGWSQNTPENMMTWLRDPNAVKPGNLMGQSIKAGTLNENEIADLTAYLESLE